MNTKYRKYNLYLFHHLISRWLTLAMLANSAMRFIIPFQLDSIHNESGPLEQ